MAIFLDPRGRTSYGVAICDRCRFKRFTDELVADPNYPGLRVCDPSQVREGCKDQFDPWRLPARQTENITLRFVRPDVPLQDRQVDTVQRILALRWIDPATGQSILTEDGQYIDMEVPPLPDEEPLT